MIPYFLGPESHIEMTYSQAQWIETNLMIGAFCGLPVSMILVQKLGRKNALSVSCLSMSTCWFLIAIANQLWILYVARFGMGLGLNMAYVTMPMYVGEISDKKIRGILSSCTLVFMMVGVLIMYCVGPFVPYIVPPFIAIVLLLCEITFFFFLPESPQRLLEIGQLEKARTSLQIFRGKNDVEAELGQILTSRDKNEPEGMRCLDLFTVPNNRRALTIMSALNSSQCFGCNEILIMNLHEILNYANSVYFDPSLNAIVISAVMLVSSLASSVLVDKLGRKVLLISSTIGSTICLLILASYFNLIYLDYDVDYYSWVPLLSVVSYSILFKLGLGTVSIVITSEIYPQKLKTLGMIIGDATYIVSSVISLQIFFALKTFGMHVPFYFFAAWLFVMIPYIVYQIPETKGKSLNDIQDILAQKK